jgi:signal transduction histidine kinase
LTQACIESLIEAIKNIRQRSKEKRWVLVQESVLNAAQLTVFREAAAIASRLVAKATREKRQREHKNAIANHIVGLEKVANEVHTDATRYGTVTILLQAAGPGLAVPKTGTPADANAELVDLAQKVGEAIYLAPNVPHVVPHQKRENARISLVFFF